MPSLTFSSLYIKIIDHMKICPNISHLGAHIYFTKKAQALQQKQFFNEHGENMHKK